jgi:hypothetical protein
LRSRAFSPIRARQRPFECKENAFFAIGRGILLSKKSLVLYSSEGINYDKVGRKPSMQDKDLTEQDILKNLLIELESHPTPNYPANLAEIVRTNLSERIKKIWMLIFQVPNPRCRLIFFLIQKQYRLKLTKR